MALTEPNRNNGSGGLRRRKPPPPPPPPQQQQQQQEDQGRSTRAMSMNNKEKTSNSTSWLDAIITTLKGGDWKNDLTPPSSTLDIPNYGTELLRIDHHFIGVAIFASIVFTSMATFSYWLVHSQRQDSNNLELGTIERTAAGMVAICQFVSIAFKIIPLIVEGWVRSRFPQVTGVFICGMSVVSIAMMGNSLMAFGSSPPIVMDPITGTRVHLLRWSAWIPLSFVMVVLVEGSDIPNPKEGVKLVYFTAFTQMAATTFGYLFPFLPENGIHLRIATLGLAFFFTSYLYVRLAYKEARFKNLKLGNERLDEKEVEIRMTLALKLYRLLAVEWAYLVASYVTFSMVLPLMIQDGTSIWRDPSWPMVNEAVADCILKTFYMEYIVSMHQQIYDEGARSRRRLEELRKMMWTNSSDVLAISVKSLSGTILTMVSPTFFKLLKCTSSATDEKEHNTIHTQGVLFERTVQEYNRALRQDKDKEEEEDYDDSVREGRPSSTDLKLYDLDFGDLTIHNLNHKLKKARIVSNQVQPSQMKALTRLMAKAWTCQGRDSLLAHELIVHGGGPDKDNHGPQQQDPHLETIQCEAKVTRLEESSLVVVIRDVSDRFRRFEAEKKAQSEKVARQKDSEANRFTRHEVKNGLLAALGLCDSIKTISNDTTSSLDAIATMVGSATTTAATAAAATEGSERDIAKLRRMHDDLRMTLTELDSSLNDVMETVLAEAMARDVIHEAYSPQLERVDVVKEIRALSTRAKEERFPLSCSPSPFPILLFDRQLIKCIYRNAISNACKYGSPGGKVTTHLSYDKATKELYMTVTNLPGHHHDELLKLGNLATDLVFQPGKRLHPSLERTSLVTRQSAGDGAWIMQKCAKTLGGVCSLEFRNTCTVFSLRCPATPFEEIKSRGSTSAPPLVLPANTWGIAVDDSKVQRKVLSKLFGHMNIARKRTIIMGEFPEEINSFVDFVVEFIEEHPDDRFLLLVDENLETRIHANIKTETVSGSMLVHEIRHRLQPEHERQMLALIRSANDSSHDVAIYNSRAHGFIPKEQARAGVLDYIEPLWKKQILGVEADPSEGITQSSRASSLVDPLDEVSAYVSGMMESIDELYSVSRATTKASSTSHREDNVWPLIWEKLHALKGDVSCLYESPDAIRVRDLISDMRGRIMPPQFEESWNEIKKLVNQLIREEADL